MRVLTSRSRAGIIVVVLGIAGAVTAQPTMGATGGATADQHLQAQLQQKAAHAAEKRTARGEEGGEAADEVLARDRMAALITSAPAKQVSSAALAAATRQAAALPQAGTRWQEITDRPFLNDPVLGRGPRTFSNYGVNWGLVSGRMTALTASGSAVYAGAADGGVWKTTTRDGRWTPWSQGLPRQAIGALATDPSDGSVYVGLGEANTSFDAANGMGVYRLPVGATRWTRVGGTEMFSRNTYELRVIGDFVFAATSSGLWRHPAGSVSGVWELVLKPDPNPNRSVYRTSHITSVIGVPGSGGRSVLAVLGWRGGTLPGDTTYNGFYVSSSGGAPGSFQRIRPAGDINVAEIGRTTLDAAPTGRRLYAVIEDSATVSLIGQGVFVSPDGNPAGPWQRVADVDKLVRSGSALDQPPDYHPGVQAWYNQYLRVDPRNPMHVYVGLEEVFETTDGGRTWFAIGPYWDFDISCATDYYTCPPTTHPDQHAMTFVDGQVYAGSDGGVWRRSTEEHGRRGWINLNATLHTLQYYSVAIGAGPGGDRIWGGLQDNGESYLRPGAGALWQVFTGDGGDTIVDPRDGERAVVEYVYAAQALTTDAGRHYREITVSCLATLTREPIPNCDPNPRFIAPLEQDVSNPRRWITGGQYIWVDNRGWDTVCDLRRCDWRRVHDLGEGNSTTALALSGSTIYAAYCGGPCNPDQGGPFTRGVATNAGGRWHDITAGLPNRYITALTVDPSNARHVYATVGGYNRRWIPAGGVGHVFESNNAGSTWQDITGDLPDNPALQLVISGGRLVVATDVGVFTAETTAPSRWARLGSALPPVRVWDLKVNPSRDYLIAATHGRGMWQQPVR